jgi:hypothetical protein
VRSSPCLLSLLSFSLSPLPTPLFVCECLCIAIFCSFRHRGEYSLVNTCCMILRWFHQNCTMHIRVRGVLQLTRNAERIFVCSQISARSLHFVFTFTCIQAYQYYDRCVVRLVDVVMCVFICIQVMRVGGSYCPRGSMPTTSRRALPGARQRCFYRVFKERVFLIFIHKHTQHNTHTHTHTHTHRLPAAAARLPATTAGGRQRLQKRGTRVLWYPSDMNLPRPNLFITFARVRLSGTRTQSTLCILCIAAAMYLNLVVNQITCLTGLCGCGCVGQPRRGPNNGQLPEPCHRA